MPQITFVQANGKQTVVEARAGTTLMEAAIDHGVPGIVGECGGACSCGTCHVFVDAPWSEALPPMTEQEDAMLEGTLCPREPGSRISCELEVTPAFDGMVVRLPARQV